jgi:hypothetical protein
MQPHAQEKIMAETKGGGIGTLMVGLIAALVLAVVCVVIGFVTGSVLLFTVLAVLVFVIVVVAVGFMLERDPVFQSSRVIKASPEAIHEWVGDLRKWDEWGPWRDDDPNITYEYSDTTTQIGDTMHWKMKQGTGNVKITSTDPQAGVHYMFQWGKQTPLPGKITYRPVDDGTEVTWWFQVKSGNNIFARCMLAAFRGRMVGMFDKGLKGLQDKLG